MEALLANFGSVSGLHIHQSNKKKKKVVGAFNLICSRSKEKDTWSEKLENQNEIQNEN